MPTTILDIAEDLSNPFQIWLPWPHGSDRQTEKVVADWAREVDNASLITWSARDPYRLRSSRIPRARFE
jgi:hypothetical protein